MKAELGDLDDEVTQAIIKQSGLPCEVFAPHDPKGGRPDLPRSIAEEETIPGSPPMIAPVVSSVGATPSTAIDLDDSSDVEVEYHNEISSPNKNGLDSPSVSLIY